MTKLSRIHHDVLLEDVRVLDIENGLVQAWVVQNVTFSRPPSGEWLARTHIHMRSAMGTILVAKVELTHPPRRYAKNIWVSSAKFANTELRQTPVHVRRHGDGTR